MFTANSIAPEISDKDCQIVTGVSMGTILMTMSGELPVEYLGVGDRVLTRNGARKIRAITVMVADNSEVVRVSQRSLGHDRPSEDILLPAAQAILIRDWRAQALFGRNQAVVPAARLADGEYIRVERATGQRFFALTFDEPEVIYAQGLELPCQGLTVAA